MKEKLTASEKKIRKDIQATRAAGGLKFLNKDETSKYAAWARAQIKDDRITIRVPGADKRAIMALAAKEGKKYQTYLGEMIHREAAKASALVA
jgi:predicted DNA binding CopG/RHH family protein